jgi:PBP1b-binding outer membrane lipoprotein LpoB
MVKLTLAITLAFLLSACGNKESAPSPAAAQTPPQSAVEFNNAVQQGFQSKKAPPLDTSAKTYKKLDLYPNK